MDCLVISEIRQLLSISYFDCSCKNIKVDNGHCYIKNFKITNLSNEIIGYGKENFQRLEGINSCLFCNKKEKMNIITELNEIIIRRNVLWV